MFSDEILRKALARASLTGYKHYVSPRFGYAWDAKHQLYLDNILMDVEAGRKKRVIINMPPRHFKSQTSTAHFPAWYLGRNPDHMVMTASYAASLVEDFSAQTRALITEFGPELFGVTISQRSRKINNWKMAGHIGGLKCAGVGGSLTGKGAHLAIIDDPHKDRAEANSDTVRERVWEWYTSVLRTRLEPNGAIIVIQTRWHDEDLAGKLIMAMGADDPYADQWEIISFPALAEENDVLGRKEGEPLWFDLKTYYSFRSSIGTYEWHPQYQQRPQDVGGGAFKAYWWKWYTKNDVSYDPTTETWYFHGEPMVLWQGTDPAISEDDAADDFVLFTIGITPTNKIVFLDPFDGHLEFTEQVKMVVHKYQEWMPMQNGIEEVAYQKALKQQVIKDALVNIKAITRNNKVDKYTRIMTMTPYAENGQMYMREATEDEPYYVDNARLPNKRIHSKFSKLYLQAVKYTATSTHDDILDALQNAIAIARPQMMPNEFYV